MARKADPEIVEEWKWENPVWSRGGLVCTGEAYKSVVKLTFAKGASLEDPSRLFNSSFEGRSGEPSTFARVRSSTRRASGRSSGRPSRSTSGAPRSRFSSPFYGVEGRGWFLSFHVFTRYVKVTFFRGTSLRPVTRRRWRGG